MVNWVASCPTLIHQKNENKQVKNGKRDSDTESGVRIDNSN